ncbi:antibiotic biosynthesis monooxygenase [Paenibacillus glycanilyticus]|uniref:antibiotic biosynthesis monooxygenase n=1 Tax=Paenibacillus glycanilyticus TaxID=126569 RepID=UPI00203E28A6|nr:antibiotic biosynthesis monooxygenase [Paenibacillus glycanilyticus]MCM3631421.1 antibiotic biosynthesis monooxygenase [Paenibacillus glycanilyticus]
MIVVTNTIKVKKGHGEEVAERFQKTKGIEHTAGFVRMEVMLTESLVEYDELKVCTTWENKASFEGWVNSDSFRQAHAHRGNKQAESGKAQDGEGERIMLGSHLTTHRILVARAAAAIV